MATLRQEPKNHKSSDYSDYSNDSFDSSSNSIRHSDNSAVNDTHKTFRLFGDELQLGTHTFSPPTSLKSSLIPSSQVPNSHDNSTILSADTGVTHDYESSTLASVGRHSEAMSGGAGAGAGAGDYEDAGAETTVIGTNGGGNVTTSNDLFEEDIDKMVKNRNRLMGDLNIDAVNYEHEMSAMLGEGDEKKIGDDGLKTVKESEERKSIIPAPEPLAPIDTDRPTLSATTTRAATVRTVFESFYNSLERYQNKAHYADDGLPKYAGVEGVFNPLQIIRNRRIRKKDGQSLRKGELAKIRLPSQTFSRHKKSRLIWQVNPYEYSGDIDWRDTHWNQLRKPDGELWFAVVEKNAERSRRDKATARTAGAIGSYSGFDGEYNLNEETRSSSVPKTSESSASMARHEQYVRVSGLKAYPRMHLWSLGNESGALLHHEHGTISPPLHLNSGLKIVTPTPKAGSLVSSKSKSPDVVAVLSGSPSPYKDAVTSLILDHHSNSPAAPSSSTTGFVDEENVSDTATLEEEAQAIKRLRFKLTVSRFKINSMGLESKSLLAKNRGLLEEKLEEFERHQMEDLVESRQLGKKIEEIDSAIDKLSVFNNQKSIQIEESLGYCDRTNGEINTSIALKIRDLGERIDKLLANDSNRLMNILYNFIERAIVFLLWCIWIVVEVWRFVRGIVRFFWKLLKWVLL
ncbi:DEKNAAC105339 [Brettanomyces naardenensis]|uniref:DEKNAAC105339 n=1 Tax=Brettanomyces naardenensis TaxID=13370 RepID=A0A448YT88_BRENA|nr:DEKNAAC105339 [Brettanomyces naardenensis]